MMIKEAALRYRTHFKKICSTSRLPSACVTFAAMIVKTIASLNPCTAYLLTSFIHYSKSRIPEDRAKAFIHTHLSKVLRGSAFSSGRY